MRPSRVESSKISSTLLPRISARCRPAKRSAEALTSTTRSSRVNSMRPSCKRAHDLIEVFLEGGEDFLDVADLAAQAIDLGVHRAVLVGLSRRLRSLGGDLDGHGIQPARDSLQRLQRPVGEARGQRQRDQHRHGGKDQRTVERGLQLALQKDRGKPDANLAEGSAVALDRQAAPRRPSARRRRPRSGAGSRRESAAGNRTAAATVCPSAAASRVQHRPAGAVHDGRHRKWWANSRSTDCRSEFSPASACRIAGHRLVQLGRIGAIGACRTQVRSPALCAPPSRTWWAMKEALASASVSR